MLSDIQIFPRIRVCSNTSPCVQCSNRYRPSPFRLLFNLKITDGNDSRVVSSVRYSELDLVGSKYDRHWLLQQDSLNQERTIDWLQPI